MKNLIALTIVLFAFTIVNAKDTLKVNESMTQVYYRDGNLQVLLNVTNEKRKTDAKIQLDILGVDGTVLARADENKTIARGVSSLNFEIPLKVSRSSTDLIWQRLRYSVSDGKSNDSGIISLSEIMPELYKINAWASDSIFAGMNYVIRVRTFHPLKELVVPNVKIDAELKLNVEKNGDEKELLLKASGRTDKEGYTTLNFEIPEGINIKAESYYGGMLTLIGEKNGLKTTASDSLGVIRNRTYVYLNTDKPLYQPNQKISIRGLALENNFALRKRKTVADRDLEFKIEDEEGTVLYRQTVKTSRFGVASIDWQIPDNAKLGRYRIEVGVDGKNETLGSTSFKVSRYELPNFIVKTKTDKDFYLPEDKEAEVTIDAVYLFGKDVAGGKVKIVRESDRTWNYKTQKWDVDEEETFEGETDEDGKFMQKIDLSDTHKELTEDDYRKFEDLKFSAYFTDSTTNITEQRRFDIRVSKEPIHVYLIGWDEDGNLNNKFPQEFFVTTSSAEGKPIASEVEILGRYEDKKNKEYKSLRKVKTNEFGAAKIEFKLPKCGESCYEDFELKVIARNSDGGIGTFESNDDVDVDDDEEQIRIYTEKTIFKPNEPLKLEIRSTENERLVFVDVMRGGSSLSSHQVKLKKGRAKLTIPYKDSFTSNLRIVAHFDEEYAIEESVVDAKGIIYPAPRNLRLNVKSSKEIFRPAENATLQFNVSSPNRSTSENALGVFVLDKAVEERALTDSNFGGGFNTFGDFQSLLGNETSFGGLTQNDIEELDLSKPISDDVQLAAEVMFYAYPVEPASFRTYHQENLIHVFSNTILKQFTPIDKVLDKVYKASFEHPTDVDSFKNILGRNGINFDSLVDLWGEKYKVDIRVEKDQYVMKIWSDGANKKFEREGSYYAGDDFIAYRKSFRYFTEMGRKIDDAVQDHYKKTGEFVRDEATLKNILLEKGIDLENLKDKWGEKYRFEFNAYKRFYTIEIQSGGRDKKFDENYYTDFTIWTARTDYFAQPQIEIERILNEHAVKEKKYPRDTVEFKRILKDGGIDFDKLRDGWGNPFFIEAIADKRFTDRVKIESVAKDGEKPQEKYVVTPVTQEILTFRIRSNGENGVKEQYDWRKPTIANFTGVISEQTKDDAKPKLVLPKAILANGNSVIFGSVADQQGALIPGAEILLTDSKTNAELKAESNEQGTYVFKKVPAGIYTLRVNATGFSSLLIKDIKIAKEQLREINTKLYVGGVNSVVSVSAGEELVDSSNAKVDTNVTVDTFDNLPKGTSFGSLLRVSPGVVSSGVQINASRGDESIFVIDGQEVSDFASGSLNSVNVVTKSGEVVEEKATARTRKETPRLRNYFPETLLWNPEIITDSNGKAILNFKLADNITTWKIYAIASNLDGDIGVAEKEIKAFQPFFVDLLPPRVLTKGDEIYLPVQVRNYTEEQQTVDVEMAKADWFSFISAERGVPNARSKQVSIPKNSTQNTVFGYRAESVIDEGFQKVTAIADKESDAIEKPVTVKPDGKEVVQTASEIFTDSVTFDVDFPVNTLPNTQKAEIKIYPNLFAHVAESVEGLLKRPYGCGEQTISSTYPNLMILKFAKKDNRLRPIAQRFLQKGYERLLGYQTSSGGFGYWGGEEGNIALTAYALRFLSDADGFIEVDADVMNNARNWLISQQTERGSWTQYYYGETRVEDTRRTWQISTYVAKSLAMTERDKQEKNENVQKALDNVFNYLKRQNETIDEPYALANFGLALIDAGKKEEAEIVAAKLESMAINEGSSVYWKLETNTPFYGWGTAGRIETSALVVELLTRVSGDAEKEQSKRKDLISKGTMFLLKNKDRYGVWYSTQTTINVLNAFLASIGSDRNISSKEKRFAGIFVNGKKIKDMELPPADKLGFPLTIRLDSILNPRSNKFEIKTNGDGISMMAQVVQNHYISWDDWAGNNTDINKSRQISLDYSCDKQKAKPTEEITCDVKAERVGFRGYGMLLAEIGIPPGADVDRASLEKAKDDDWSFSRYDVLPDRIIVYMWSRAGGTNFKFKFKPRYGINAQTPASSVYDYYNEEAKATVAPIRFEIE